MNDRASEVPPSPATTPAVAAAVETGQLTDDDTDVALEKLALSITDQIGTEKDQYEKSNTDLETLAQHLEKKEYVKAISSLFKLLFKSFSLKSRNGFAHLNKYRQQLNLEGKTQTEVVALIQGFSKKLEKSDFSISDITDTTFLLSLCKDKRLQMEYLAKWQPAPTPYESLLYNLNNDINIKGSREKDATGTVLLFNRWAGKAETHGRKSRVKDTILNPRTQSVSGSGFQHAVVISRVESDGSVWITHANQDGVVEEKLETYLNRRGSKDGLNVDVMAIEAPEGKWPEVAHFAQQQKRKKYDTLWMAHDTLAGKRDETNSKNLVVNNDPNAFYCSELIFSGLEASWYAVDKELFTPGDLAKAFTPQYCTTIKVSQLWH